MTLTDALPTAPTPTPSSTPSPAGPRSRASTLYPHQEEALIELVSGANVILARPTGSGKSLVAAGAHFAALADGRAHLLHRADQGAGVGEVLRPVRRSSAPSNVGMMTGDASVNADAPIICCTAEILANIALRDGRRRRRRPGRDGRVPLLRRPRPRLGLAGAAARAAAGAVPADVGHARRRHAASSDDLTRRTGRPTAVVTLGRAAGAADLLRTRRRRCTRRSRSCSTTEQAPVYVVHFTQAAALERAQALMSVNVCTRAEKDAIAEADRRLPVHRRLRQDAVPAGPARHRRAPRRHAAQVPPAGGDARPGRAAQGHLRHRHPRRRHQRADPHGAVHRR